MALGLRVKLTGAEAFEAALGRLAPDRNPAPFRKALRRLALKVQELAQTKYILSGGSGPPHPSLLTSRTGTLRRSIGVETTGDLAVAVGTDLIYGAAHELPQRAGYPARPFLGPAVAEISPEVGEVMRVEWERAVRG